MALDTVGILTPLDFPAEQTTRVSSVMREIFVDETPLWSRLPHVQASSQVYTIDQYDVRGGLNRRAYAVGTGGVTTTSQSLLPLADASMFQVGDVLELQQGSGDGAGPYAFERVEVLAPPNLSATPNTLTIRRAREGTSAATFVANDVVYLVSNSRTGGEIDQQAFRAARTPIQQIVQTFMTSVQIGGLAQRIQNVALPSGASDVMGLERAIKLVEQQRDVENSFYYGLGEVPLISGDRAKSKGFKGFLAQYNGGSNLKTGSVLTGYTLSTFIADTIQKIYSAGGMPDTILCSTDFLGILNTWVPNKTTFMNDQTPVLGFPVQRIAVPLMGAKNLEIVPSLQLRPGTAIVTSSVDLDVRFLSESYWKPRGNRGDADMGDWIGDYCLNMNRPQWHAMVEGIASAA